MVLTLILPCIVYNRERTLAAAFCAHSQVGDTGTCMHSSPVTYTIFSPLGALPDKEPQPLLGGNFQQLKTSRHAISMLLPTGPFLSLVSSKHSLRWLLVY